MIRSIVRFVVILYPVRLAHYCYIVPPSSFSYLMIKTIIRKNRNNNQFRTVNRYTFPNQQKSIFSLSFFHIIIVLLLLLVLSLCVMSFSTGVTILVSQTVLSLLIRRVITKTSEAIPLLGS